jgi:hypothetical protein
MKSKSYMKRKMSVALAIQKMMNMSSMTTMLKYRAYPNISLIHKAVIKGSLKTMGGNEKAIYAAAEFTIRNSLSIIKFSNRNFIPLYLPESFEHHKCCEKTPSWIKRHRVSDYHKKSILHLSNVFECSLEIAKEFSGDDFWPCLIHLDDRLDTYFDKKYRKRKFSGN